ncbi:abscisic acid-deficient protein Aba4 family protein [Roseicyclus amphidinii]|uniref:abscisic acid-deficient protein Aba4 family protein n=1 Tax=Roseicyclus amphidinii TaxID=3034232 RepID=UPI0024E11877|nr:abscisic acid-deficient protein Aba4 family protein [Roseicyclus sp. Amp-Y-6]
MTPEDIFSLAGAAAGLGWALLVLGPRRFGWLNAVPLWIVPAGLSLVYALLVLSRFSGTGGGFDSLASVAVLLSDDWALLAGWVHYLAFDLFVGAVMAARMDRAGVGRVVQAPILISIFMLGPLGFLIAALTEGGLRARLIPTQTQTLALKGATHVAA